MKCLVRGGGGGLDGSRGRASLAGSYGSCVAQGLVLASGMHTCLYTSFFSPDQTRERETGGGEDAGVGDSARTCTTAPCPCLRVVGEETGRIKRVRCQRCGLEGCKGHEGNVASEVIHL